MCLLGNHTMSQKTEFKEGKESALCKKASVMLLWEKHKRGH